MFEKKSDDDATAPVETKAAKKATKEKEVVTLKDICTEPKIDPTRQAAR
jgi:hypothetical protein